MAGVTPKKLAKAVAVVGVVIEQRIDESVQTATRYRELLYLLKRLEPAGSDSRVPRITESVKSGPKGRIAPGSIPDRVLEIVGEFDGPCTMAQILEAKHGAKNSLIITAVRTLVRSGHLAATGATLSRRYHLPASKARRSA